MSTQAEINLINTDVAAWCQSLNVSWSQLKVVLRGKIVEAGLTGGVTSYTLNGRTVSVSLDFLEKALSIAESRAGGGIIMQPGAFRE